GYNQALPDSLSLYYDHYNDACWEYYYKHNLNRARELCDKALTYHQPESRLIDLYIRIYTGLKKNKEEGRWAEYSIIHYGFSIDWYAYKGNDYGLAENHPVIKALRAKENALKTAYYTPFREEEKRVINDAWQCYWLLKNDSARNISMNLEEVRK